MARSFLRQDTQIYSSDVYDDTIAPTLAAFETNPLNAEQDLNNLRSMASELRDVRAGNWYDALVAPTALETGTARGVQNVNDGLHLIEKKRILREVVNIVPLTVGGADNFLVIPTAGVPTQTTAAVGLVTTLGTVVAAHTGTFGQHSLDEVVGSSAVSPINLVSIVDDVTHDPILSGGNLIYGLLQSENAADGHTITDTTPNRIQISFVVINGAGNDLIACPAVDIQGKVIHYFPVERIRFEDTTEQDFLSGRVVDVPAGTTVSRQAGYTNQGTTPVDVVTNSTLDLEGPGLTWTIRDDLEAMMFELLEGSAGGTSEVRLGAAVDTFNNDAIVNDFASGLRADTGGERIDIGETAGVIESTGANDLRVLGAGELFLDDGNQTGSTWAQVDGVKLSETTAEWDAYEAEFGGEVSLLNAIVLASNAAARNKGQAVLTANVAADNDVALTTAGNLDVDLPDYSGVASFVDDVDVFLNGALLRGGANAAANEDVYPGTTPAVGMLRFEFPLKGGGAKPDVLTMIVNGQ